MRLRLLFLLSMLVACPRGLALDAGRALTQYRIDSWNAKLGLPENSVESLAQTPDGYLWFGTQEGLARFDGVKFTVFDKRNTPELAHNRIAALLVDRTGSLWIGTDGGGLTRLRSGQFRRFSVKDGLPSEIVRSLAETSDGSVWIATDRGLARMAPGSARAEPVREFAGQLVDCIVPAPEGALWVGAPAGVRLLRGSTLLAPEGAPHRRASALWAEPDGDVWCEGEDGALLRVGRSPERYGKEAGLSGGVRALLRDRDGILWIGTSNGLFRLVGKRLEGLVRGGGLLTGYVIALLEDREGSVWIGMQDEGLKRFADTTFVTWGPREGLRGEIVSPILETRDGALWFGSRGGGLDRLKDGRVTNFGPKEIGTADVQSLAEDRDGALWVGTRDTGLVRLREGKVDGCWGRADGLASNSVRSLVVGPDGALWVGGSVGALQRLKNGRLTTWDTSAGLPPNEIFHLQFDDAGVLWLCTNGGGLVRFTESAPPRAFTTKDGLSVDLVNTLHVDRDGTFWIGTYGGGLNRMKGGRIVPVTTKQGLFDDAVFRILDDGEGSLWVSCNKGVYQVAKKDLDAVADGRAASVRCVPYGTADGMRNSECNGADQPVGWRTRDGRLFFPTVEGAVAVDPHRIRRNPLPPPVVVEEVLSDGAVLPRASGSATVPAGARRLEFRYTALSFLVPERVRFRYRLEGFDPDWVDAGTKRVATYTNVPPGNLAFRVIACNDSDVWNETGARLPLRVKPRFRQTVWFWLLVAGALGAAAAGVHKGRVRHLKAQKAALEAQVEEKVRALSQAEAKIAALTEADPSKLENVSGWAASIAAEIARMIGARAIGVFRFDGGEFKPLAAAGMQPPSAASLRQDGTKRAFPRTADSVAVPVNGMTGELRGVLAIEGMNVGSVWNDSHRRLVLGFAQHLGGALELLDLRERLTSAANERERARRSMQERGVETVVVCPRCRACFPEAEKVCPTDGSALDRSRLLPYLILGRYRLTRLLGEGGMGIVFSAHDEELGRDVAVKVIRSEQLSDAAGRLRLEREARAIARIRHPGVVALHDAQELEDGSACLVMELLRGLDLGQVLLRFGPGGPRQVAELARQTGAALSSAHRAGVVHRDVKPGNVFLEISSEGMKVKVVDFGLAQSDGSGEKLTKTGIVVGTPLYMSPEQVRGSGRLDARSDLFSLAAVLFEAFTGRSPFEGGDTARVWLRIVGEAPPPASSFVPGVPAAVDALFFEALAKDPRVRPSSTEDWCRRLADALDSFEQAGGAPGLWPPDLTGRRATAPAAPVA